MFFFHCIFCQSTERHKAVDHIAIIVTHQPLAVLQIEMICGFIGDNCPISVTIIIEVPIICECIVVVFEIVVQLTDFAPIIIIIAIIVIDPISQNMVLIACFRKDKSVISLAVPPIGPNFSDDIVFIKHIIGIGCQTC